MNERGWVGRSEGECDGVGLVFMRAGSSTEQGDKLAERSWDGGKSFWRYE